MPGKFCNPRGWHPRPYGSQTDSQGEARRGRWWLAISSIVTSAANRTGHRHISAVTAVRRLIPGDQRRIRNPVRPHRISWRRRQFQNQGKPRKRTLRRDAGPDDVFVIFDTKGDFLEDFYRTGDAVLSSRPHNVPGGVTWNLFRDLLGQDQAERSDQIYEIASTVFSEEISRASDNYFFAAAARDIFAAVVEIMSDGDAQCSNGAPVRPRETGPGVVHRIRHRHGQPPFTDLPDSHGHGDQGSAGARTAGDQEGTRGNVFFVLDEFALLPELSHSVRESTSGAVSGSSSWSERLHDALKRRCLYHWIGYPGPERVAAIIRRRVPGASDRLAGQVAESVRLAARPGPDQAAGDR